MTQKQRVNPEPEEFELPEPLIFSRSEHPISRKNIDREALKVMHRLRDAGFSAYLVGGGVRDLFLGKTPKDFDISTDARPGQIQSIFKNSRVIGRRFRLVQVFFRGGKIVEVSTLRCRGEYDLNGQDEVLASNNTFGTLPEDALRRDLTINALFYDIENFTIIDYVGGVQDLKDGIVRLIGNAERRIIRDPVRMIRAIRHAARADFTIDDETWQAIKKYKNNLALCPVSRIRDELLKDLKGGAARSWMRFAHDCGIFTVLFPCYEKVLENRGDCGKAGGPSADKDDPYKELQGLLAVIDRLSGEGQILPEHLLFALLLIPWARKEMGLLGKDRQKGEVYTFSRNLRARLDEILAHLNIARLTKENITSLLVNLAVFERHGRGKWPKWLMQKSYFQECLEFYRLYQEACGGEKVETVKIVPLPPAIKKRPSGKPSRAPVFSSARGGIFGLKKKQ
ncbi:MAG: poly(A) polymerase [Deltaproteobacteria bacterium RIFOXYD12_FULL_50_9]|nr:MAG: poly(A) polymerase [Deltaproteobacteria bacterium RIFOXYD12_FULL_50_9]